MALRTRIGFWLIIVAVLAAFLFVMPAASKSTWSDILSDWFADYDDVVDDDDTAQNDTDKRDEMLVTIDPDVIDDVGIETMTLVASQFLPETKAIATVVDLRPMLELRTRHNQVETEVNIAKIAEQASQKEFLRLKALAKNSGSIATKNIHFAETDWRQAQAQLIGLNAELEAVRQQALQAWGNPIANWILAKDETQWQQLLSHQNTLLIVTLPIDVKLPEYVRVIRIVSDTSGDYDGKATFVSPTVISNPLFQGESYFFKTTQQKLRTGMKLNVWLPIGEQPLSGVFIPEQAIVWNAGQPWVYVEQEHGTYQRRSLNDAVAAASGLFTQRALQAGEQLVTRGGQMLLSEEFKWQILDEDDD